MGLKVMQFGDLTHSALCILSASCIYKSHGTVTGPLESLDHNTFVYLSSYTFLQLFQQILEASLLETACMLQPLAGRAFTLCFSVSLLDMSCQLQEN